MPFVTLVFSSWGCLCHRPLPGPLLLLLACRTGQWTHTRRRNVFRWQRSILAVRSSCEATLHHPRSWVEMGGTWRKRPCAAARCMACVSGRKSKVFLSSILNSLLPTSSRKTFKFPLGSKVFNGDASKKHMCFSKSSKNRLSHELLSIIFSNIAFCGFWKNIYLRKLSKPNLNRADK